MFSKASRKEYSTILAMTCGSALEWYEVFLYIYWAPIISKLFFNETAESKNLINSLFIFMVGFWARPIGGYYFGRIGDLVGRKYTLILSIVILIFPTFCMGLLPTYEQVGILSPICLVLLRFLQAIPSGGELPGSFCYLYEYAPLERRRYITSWGYIGSQMGIAISLIESKYLEHVLSPAALVDWGWRLSFIFGSLIALLGLCLRTRLHETSVYQQLERRHEKLKISLFQILSRYRRSISTVIALGIMNSTGFYILSIIFPVYISRIFNIEQNGILFGLCVLLLGAIFIPFFGFLGDRFNNKKILIVSTIGNILLLYPMYFSVAHEYYTSFLILLLAFTICLSASAALLLYRFAAMFHANIRFTAVGIGFNVVDGVLGSLGTVLAFYFVDQYKSLLPCFVIIFICAVISLLAMCAIDEKKEH